MQSKHINLESLGLTLDRSSAVPLYEQINSRIRACIESGRLERGTMLPTNREICQRLDVTYTTVHKAMAKLAEEGVVARRPGKGTFVADVPRRGLIAVCVSDEMLVTRSSDMPRQSLVFTRQAIAEHGRRYQFYVLAKGDGSDNVGIEALQADLQAGRVAGVFVLSWVRQLKEVLPIAAQRKIPVATVSSGDKGLIPYAVRFDAERFLHDAAGDLVRAGCKRIGVVYSIGSHFFPVREQIAEMIRTAGATTGLREIIGRPPTAEDGWKAAASLDWSKLDGLIVTDTVMAFGVQRYLKEQGIAIGKQVRVAALWNASTGVSLEPAAWLYAVDFQQQIVEALALLAEAMKGWRVDDPTRNVPAHRVQQPGLAGLHSDDGLTAAEQMARFRETE